MLNWAYLPLQNLSYSIAILSTCVKISTNYKVFTTRLKYGGVHKWRHQFFLKFWPLLLTQVITFLQLLYSSSIFFPPLSHLKTEDAIYEWPLFCTIKHQEWLSRIRFFTGMVEYKTINAIWCSPKRRQFQKILIYLLTIK